MGGWLTVESVGGKEDPKHIQCRCKDNKQTGDTPSLHKCATHHWRKCFTHTVACSYKSLHTLLLLFTVHLGHGRIKLAEVTKHQFGLALNFLIQTISTCSYLPVKKYMMPTQTHTYSRPTHTVTKQSIRLHFRN